MEENLITFITEQVPDVRPLSLALAQTQAEFDGYAYTFVDVRDGYLLLFQPYRPLVVERSDVAFVDGYYNAYQTLYAAKKAVSALLAARYPNATAYHGSYKALLGSLGLGECLQNTLLFLSPFGTFFCVEIIDLLGRPARPQITTRVAASTCAACGKCTRACPTGALANGGFEITRCIRQWQFDMADPADPRKRAAVGNQVLGCNHCQMVCPKNHAISQKYVRPDDSYLARFSLDTLALACCAPDFKKSAYAAVVGYNYAKPMKILSFVLSAMLHHDGAAHLPTIYKCLAMENPNAKPLLRQYIALCQKGVTDHETEN